MYILVVVLPLLSGIVVGMYGRNLGRKGAGWLSTSIIGVTWLLSLVIFYEVCILGSKSIIKLGNWFDSGLLLNSWGFLFDSVTGVMLVVVTTISFLVHMYSTGYMEGDPHIVRFMSYLSWFTFFMLCLVTADNFVQMFLGWEGVGLASYLLINFWYTRVQANKAAIKAVIVNRVGDIGITVGILGVYWLFKSVNFNCVFALVYALKDVTWTFLYLDINAVSIIAFFLFIGAVGKSAQLGLHTWLPDAMEGPTPVSALIHAATMVTAGVFVLVRCSPLLEYSSGVLVIITIFGALTAFFAGTIGIFQNDLKRVIAYSTCSQLGYMVFACGLSNYSTSMFHLLNHAVFKALLFLSAGSVIHALMDEQDMRRMGGLIKLLPLTFVMFMIGSLALMGFPFTTGYYSKDVILELARSSYHVEGIFAYWLGVLGAICTAFYSFRLIYLTFIAETNSKKVIMKYVHDAPIIMALPLIILGIGSIFVGYVLKDMFVGLGSFMWDNGILNYNINNDILFLEAEFLPVSWKMLPVVLSLIGGLSALLIYSNYSGLLYKLSLTKGGLSIYKFFNKKWYFDLVYNHYIVKKVLVWGYEVSFKSIDRGIIEMIGPTGLVRVVKNWSEKVSKLQSGYLYNYIFIMVMGVMGLVIVLGIISETWVSSMSGVLLVILYGVIYDLIRRK